jgi:diacylglycerol kinase family enzyme
VPQSASTPQSASAPTPAPASTPAPQSASAFDPCDFNHLFIVNPNSFHRKIDMDTALAAVEDTLAKYEGIRSRIHISRFPRDAMGAVSRYISESASNRPLRVYAVGGSGIVFDCLNAVMGLNGAELAIVPFGRENEYLRTLGHAAEDKFRDIAAQMTSASIPADVICCNGNYAVDCCAIGLESQGKRLRMGFFRYSTRLRNAFGVLGASITKITNLLGAMSGDYFSQNYAIVADGERLDGSYSAIHISKGPCFEGAAMPTNESAHGDRAATPTNESAHGDGRLELVIGRAKTRFSAVTLLPGISGGSRYGLMNTEKMGFTHRFVKSADISSDRPMIVSLDSEIFYETAINVRIIPGGARIIAPHSAGRRRRLPPPAEICETG